MTTNNGTSTSRADLDPISVLAANLAHVFEYVLAHPPDANPAPAEPVRTSRPARFIGWLGRTIAAYPLLSVGIAFGLGYRLTRLIRR